MGYVVMFSPNFILYRLGSGGYVTQPNPSTFRSSHFGLAYKMSTPSRRFENIERNLYEPAPSRPLSRSTKSKILVEIQVPISAWHSHASSFLRTGNAFRTLEAAFPIR